MFSNRFFRLKLGAALAAIALLGVLAVRRGEPINPTLWRCVAEPARWDGTRLWLPYATILSVRESDFRVASGDTEIRVVGRAPAAVGGFITLSGTFRADGPSFEMDRNRVLPPHFRLRWLIEAVSVAVVLAVLANFCRHFLFRPKVLQAEGAD